MQENDIVSAGKLFQYMKSGGVAIVVDPMIFSVQEMVCVAMKCFIVLRVCHFLDIPTSIQRDDLGRMFFKSDWLSVVINRQCRSYAPRHGGNKNATEFFSDIDMKIN